MSDPFTELKKVADQVMNQIAELRMENSKLRAMLASSDQPCAYCGIQKSDWPTCIRGFPGCPRADDASLFAEPPPIVDDDDFRACQEDFL